MPPVRRRFFDLADRQIHFRSQEAGGGLPLIALHALPGSAKQVLPFVQAIEGRSVIAPDLAGFGDSDPHPSATPAIADHARDLLALTDGLGLAHVDLYGTHTGAAVAIEMAIAAPGRVRRVVLDGVPLFDPAAIGDMAARYAPVIEPDHDGVHLLRAHNLCRDMLMFWPWYDKSAAAVRRGGLPEPRALHDWVLEVIKGLDAMPGGYRAAFAYDAAARLPLVGQPALCVTCEADTLAEKSRRAAELLAAGQLVAVEGGVAGMSDPVAVARATCAFLDCEAV